MIEGKAVTVMGVTWVYAFTTFQRMHDGYVGKASPNKSCKREFKWGKPKLFGFLLYQKSVRLLIYPPLETIDKYNITEKAPNRFKSLSHIKIKHHALFY